MNARVEGGSGCKREEREGMQERREGVDAIVKGGSGYKRRGRKGMLERRKEGIHE